MISPEIIAKIRTIELRTKRLLAGSYIGDHVTKQKGFGFEFEQLNDYQLGHDIRFIDWKSSARANKMLIKEYCAEKTRTMIIAVDISQSAFFGSMHGSKIDLSAQLASILALIGNYNNDMVGLILFSDEVDLFVPPAKGKKHVHMIMTKLFSIKPTERKTSLQKVLHFIGSLKKRDCLVVLVSDFIDQPFQKELKAITMRYDVIALRCLDSYEAVLPYAGFIRCHDMETGTELVLDTRKNSRNAISLLLQERLRVQSDCFKRAGVNYIDIQTGKEYLNDLIRFLQYRIQ